MIVWRINFKGDDQTPGPIMTACELKFWYKYYPLELDIDSEEIVNDIALWRGDHPEPSLTHLEIVGAL